MRRPPFSESKIAITHSFGEWYVHTEPTCTNVGVKRKDCDCGEYETEIIEKLDHVSSDWIIDTPATSSTDGLKHKECTICGETFETKLIVAEKSNEDSSDDDFWKIAFAVLLLLVVA